MNEIEQQKEEDRAAAEEAYAASWDAYVHETFDDREIRLMRNCIKYAEGDPAGLPGHNLMLVVAKLCSFLGLDPESVALVNDMQLMP